MRAPSGGADRRSGRETPFTGRTLWPQRLDTPLRSFLRTETGSAGMLLLATVAALVWTNVDPASYEHVWRTTLAFEVGHASVSHDLRYWVSSGLMTLFFFVVGLEARREFDLGELRERRRLLLPLVAGLTGIVVPVGIFLAVNAGHPSARGWGVAMSTDTAFALGALALVRPSFPVQVRAFMLTVTVVDDLVALLVIAVAYSRGVDAFDIALAGALFALVAGLIRVGIEPRVISVPVAFAAWVALSMSGVDPIVVGLAIGLVTSAAPAGRGNLERASELFRRFREQPTPELARSAHVGLTSALSRNEHLQELLHPWTSYAIVPLFALANAGIRIDGRFLEHAFSSPIALGIVAGYVIGKPVGIGVASWASTRLDRHAPGLPIGWLALAGSGSIAGIGFTVSLLIAAIAFRGEQLAEAKLGILTAGLGALLLSWIVFRSADHLPDRARFRALLGDAVAIVDLAIPVDPERDHLRGPEDAPVTLVEYGDFECPYCGQAESAVRELLRDSGDVRYVWRHLPLSDVHPRAWPAAEASEAAAEQDAFWEMHDLLLARQRALSPRDLIAYAEQLGLDVERFREELETHRMRGRVAEDVEGADRSNVAGTPTFFVNGRRHYGSYDIRSLTEAVQAARARAAIAS
ncbi:MAG TPA: Na+/H+ antiporter NhaA [Gaiellaceae bacterium]|nr:Na+/H+ antiporter NhaA [Gaiellaceae bacterium]